MPLLYSAKSLRSMQLNDGNLSKILRWKQSGQRPFGPEVCQSSLATRHYWTQWDSLVVRNGMLFRNFTKRDGSGSFVQFVVPAKLRSEILRLMHDSPMSGHLGKKKQYLKYYSISTGMV